MRNAVVLSLLLASSIALGAEKGGQSLGTFRGNQHQKERYVGKRRTVDADETRPETVSLMRLPGNLLQVSRGKSWQQTFKITREGSPSKGVKELALERPTEGPIAKANRANLNPRWFMRWLGGWKSMSGKGLVTIYEDKGLVWENEGSGQMRMGFGKLQVTWDETFTGEK